MLSLSTINGFDLLLILIIISLVIRVRMLNRECEDYVGQIIKVSQECYKLSKQVHDLRYGVKKGGE